MDLKSAIVILDEALSPEFVHEKVDSGARCTNHFCQHPLRYSVEQLFRFGFLAIVSEQQEGPSQSLLARIKELIDQVFLDSDVP